MNIDGKYFNGQTPVSKSVSLVVTNEEMIIHDASTEEIIATWKRPDIFHDENHNTAVVLGHKPDRSKVEVFNPEKIKELDLEVHSSKTIKKDLKGIYKWVAVLFVSGFLIWISIPVLSGVIARKIPFEYEVKAASHMKINEYFKPCPMTPDQQVALDLFVDHLYPKTEAERKIPIVVTVNSTPLVNAYTFPGGRIVLFKGLIDEAKTPDELLGIIAHEIGHVEARDSAGFLVRGAMLGTFFGFLTGDFSSTFAVSPQILLSTAALTFDRDQERAADAYAVKKLKSVNVSTSGLRSFFSRRSYDQDYTAPDVFMTHPNAKERISLIEETYPKEEIPNMEVLWPVIKSICN